MHRESDGLISSCFHCNYSIHGHSITTQAQWIVVLAQEKSGSTLTRPNLLCSLNNPKKIKCSPIALFPHEINMQVICSMSIDQIILQNFCYVWGSWSLGEELFLNPNHQQTHTAWSVQPPTLWHVLAYIYMSRSLSIAWKFSQKRSLAMSRGHQEAGNIDFEMKIRN